MKTRKKIKRKFIYIALTVGIILVGLVFSSNQLVQISVNSESITADQLPSNFTNTTNSQNKVALSDIKNNKAKNVILFTSSWCGSCNKLGRDLSEIAREYPNIKFYIMDLEVDREIANQLNVPITPTIVLLENGQSKNYSEVSIDEQSSIINDFNRIGIR